MKIINHKVNLPTYKILFFVFLGFFIVSLLFFVLYEFDPVKTTDQKLQSLSSGLCVGLAVATLQFFITILEQKKIAFYERLGIEDVIEDRDDKDLYREKIIHAESKIYVMGSTCSRLCDDFADFNSTNANALVLALNKGVKVRLLVSKPEFLREEDKSKLETVTLATSETLQEKYPDTFSIKYLESAPVHNVMICDDTCIFGPIFREVKSKNTPSLIAESDSVPAKAYISNFEYEWERGEVVWSS